MPIEALSPAYPNLHHVGIVVRDMDEAGKDNAARFGLSGITRRSTMRVEDALYHGVPVTYAAEFGFIDLGNASIELIQPIGTDRSPYSDTLNERGETTHHVAFIVPSIDAQLQSARNANPRLSIVLNAKMPGGIGRFVYVDGLIHGTLTELIELAQQPR